MRRKKRNLIILILFLHLAVNGQSIADYRGIDSLTSAYYNSGDWSNLIRTGNAAIKGGIDYKFLRQRLGYAYFSIGDYYAARLQFEKALSFDSYNSFTLEYLYYSYLNTGLKDYAGIIARRFDPETRQKMLLRAFVPLESIELEYDYKFAAASNRSNPRYYRIGVNTNLGYRFSLYQSFSNYKQEIKLGQSMTHELISDKQPEYFALLKWNVSDHLLFRTAYHYINSSSGTSLTNGNLFLFAVAPVFGRCTFEASGSALNLGGAWTYQAGGQTAYIFPGRLNFYLAETASGLFQQGSGSLIYNQEAGLRFSKRAWIAGNVTFGRMNNYNDFNGLYVYNSYDPLVFRTGTTLTYYLGKRIQLWVNYSYEQKEVYENNSFHYNQFSYLGGIKWKP